MKRFKIINTKVANIRSNPSNPNESNDILGRVNEGDTIDVDDSVRYFDWTDRAFYRCFSQYGEGYILTELVEPAGR